MKIIVQNLLIWFAKKIISRHRPTVIAITGSVGKTSTRNAIATVLKDKFDLRTNTLNYNNEFGVPLTIIGMDSPGGSVFGWLRVFIEAKRLAFFSKNYPKFLVLEYGADHPGDIAKLCDIAKPDIGVLTAISPVHAENFDSIDHLTEEKMILIQRIKRGGLAVLNSDDGRVRQMQSETHARSVAYGFHESAQVRGWNYRLETREDYSFDPGEQFAETHFEIRVNDEMLPANLPNLIGQAQVSAALAATAVGLHFEMELSEIIQKLSEIPQQAGRMRPLAGIKGSLILDDSYNAAPASVSAALDVLSQFHPVESGRRIAALGAMAELGSYQKDEHRMIGLKVTEIGVDVLVTVGDKAKDVRTSAIEAGLDEYWCKHFVDSEEAGRWLDKEVRKGDIVLVKGSQSARMEKVSKDLMAEPFRAEELLVRQSDKWLES